MFFYVYVNGKVFFKVACHEKWLMGTEWTAWEGEIISNQLIFFRLTKMSKWYSPFKQHYKDLLLYIMHQIEIWHIWMNRILNPCPLWGVDRQLSILTLNPRHTLLVPMLHSLTILKYEIKNKWHSTTLMHINLGYWRVLTTIKRPIQKETHNLLLEQTRETHLGGKTLEKKIQRSYIIWFGKFYSCS